MLGFEAKRARHAAAARVHLGDLGSGDGAQQRHGGGRAGDRLLVAVAVEKDPGACHRAQRQTAVGDRLQQQFLGQPGGRGDGLHAGVARQDRGVLVAQRQQAGGLHADDRATAGHPVHEVPGPVVGLADQALGQAGAAAAGRGKPHGPPGGFQELDRGPRHRRLGEAGEGIGEEDEFPLGAWPRRAAGMPPGQVLMLEPRQWPGGRHPQPALRQQPGRPHAAEQVRQRRGRGTDPVQRTDRAEHAGAERHAVPVVVGGQGLGLERGHVHAERALALAGLALQAEVQDLVQPLLAERRPRVG